MVHRKSPPKFGQAFPAALSIAKSDDLANAGTMQQSPAQLAQSASSTRSPTRPTLSDALTADVRGGPPGTHGALTRPGQPLGRLHSNLSEKPAATLHRAAPPTDSSVVRGGQGSPPKHARAPAEPRLSHGRPAGWHIQT